MAITILGNPDQLHPAYNPVVYYLDSTNKTNPSFRYVIQIFEEGTSNLLRELKVAPRPVDGYGYADISKILQTQISNALVLSNTTFIGADDNSIYNYDIKFGEEYVASESLTIAQQFLFGTTLFTQVLTAAPHGYVTGDQIFIDLGTTYGDCRDGLNGFFTILNTIGNSFIIDYQLQCTGSQVITGAISTFANQAKTRNLNLASLLDRVAFNRAYSTQSYISYSESDIILGDSTKQIITNAPRTGFQIFDFQSLFWNFYDDKLNLANCVLFENSNGSVFRMQTNDLNYNIKQVNVGPNANAIPIIGVGPLVDSTVDWYDVWSTEDCDCNSGSCNTIDISYDIGLGLNTTQITMDGAYNGANYYKFKILGTSGSAFIWWSIFNSWWEVTSVLGGGNQYLISSTGSISCPPVGVFGVEWLNGADPLFTNFEIADCDPLITQSSEKFRIYINHNCPINETQLLFMDRSGSWSSFAFTLRQTKQGTIERGNYRKEFGDLSGGKYTYNSFDSGLTTYTVNTESTYTLNTDFMTDEMSVYFEELLTSPEVYVKFDSSSDWIRCVILEGSFTTERANNKKLIRKTVNIQLAINDNINI